MYVQYDYVCIMFFMQSEILEKSLVQQISEDARGGSVSDSGTSFYHGRTPPTSASAIEQLQSLLKQKEGELANAQVSKNSKNIGEWVPG